ncbi:LLM class flavin-dependent oxidoreductase [Leucobacter sp. NPDC015123]|uniref:LLM class flavin-dependent oxidoreductase n=1 Tax=Leucobacter sp. NPDC015123 TaxID=3364129 RepID=UPI0036F47C24
MAAPKLSFLDLATVEREGTVASALAHSVRLAQTAEAGGYERIWYAEHHNMPTIASSSPAVLIAHIASQTERIGLGSGGVMLPNHSPLVVAEQFGTLAELHPGRIHLGLGRAPGTDGATFQALRRTVQAADAFPHDVLELQAYLGSDLPITGVNAYPGRGTNVPITILGSSLFGANLAAQLGLPYSFASHFAPQALNAAVQHYRTNYQPSAQHPEPYVSAGVNVIAAENDEAARQLFARAELERIRAFLSRGRDVPLTIEQAEAIRDTPAATEIRSMMRYTAVGGPERVREQLADFAKLADADELVTVHPAPTREEQLESLRLGAPELG